MLSTVTRHRIRGLDPINSFIHSPRAPRLVLPSRGLRTVPQAQSRRKYTTVLVAVTAVASLAALTCYVSNTRRAVHIDDADSHKHEVEEAAESNEEEEPPKPYEPPMGFDDIPPLGYDRVFWQPESTRTLEEHLEAESRIFKVHLPCGVTRYDTSFVGPPKPITCYSSASFIELPTHYWVFFGIYDGHNGSRVSAYLSQNLRHSLVGTLSDLYSKHATLPDSHIYLGSRPESADYWSGFGLGRPYPPTEEFDAALKQAFLNSDKEIVEDVPERALEAAKRYYNNELHQENSLSYQEAAELVSRAHCGSSAIVAVYENDTRQLRMANTGDSRAVLGRRVVDDRGKEAYEVHVLTHEQTVPSGFVTGPVRRPQRHESTSLHAFGDGPWKWSKETQQQLSSAFPFIVSKERPFAKATAEPMITNIETQPGDFLVIANQGLWASLTNEEAVGLVALWLKKFGRFVYGNQPVEGGEGDDVYDAETSSMIKTLVRFPTSAHALLRKDVLDRSDLPVDHPPKDDTFMYRMWRIPKRFVLVDKNAAQHLVRNALGGADKDLTETLLTMQLPRAGRYWNDVSVQVVFFS
ncbi:hypothetical protein D9756_008860 [Leucocoprinus leucothites]|uniref:PPM-type phosphatase domain-containing protein n=1 Tax=Leucocoprinus leucothites TaxID=201217 RepID=A0A8H5CX30_9AGAR|nr:hypothetical protein D9756_008860 [Leucoagaricus leucothites]